MKQHTWLQKYEVQLTQYRDEGNTWELQKCHWAELEGRLGNQNGKIRQGCLA